MEEIKTVKQLQPESTGHPECEDWDYDQDTTPVTSEDFRGVGRSDLARIGLAYAILSNPMTIALVWFSVGVLIGALIF